jgi:hypothetical protein
MGAPDLLGGGGIAQQDRRDEEHLGYGDGVRELVGRWVVSRNGDDVRCLV